MTVSHSEHLIDPDTEAWTYSIKTLTAGILKWIPSRSISVLEREMKFWAVDGLPKGQLKYAWWQSIKSIGARIFT